MKRKILVFLLALCLAAALVPVAAFAKEAQSANVWDGSIASAFAGGTGTAENPYRIATGAQLAYLASSVNNGETYAGKNFVLTADIDLNGLPWTPIGYSGERCFSGNYDGGGHIIANAYSTGKVDDKEGYATAGIFGWVASGSVQNLHVKAADFVTTRINNYSFVGGITGMCYGASIKNCSVTGSSLESIRDYNNNCAGSIAGYSAGGQFENCAAENNHVTSMAYGGGFVGEVDDDNAGITTPSAFINCYAAKCTVTATTGESQGSSFAGGFAGQITNQEPTAKNCFVYRVTLSTDGTSASDKSIGVFAGNLWGSEFITHNCFYGECGTTKNAEGALEKSAEEFENGTVAKGLGDAFAQARNYPKFKDSPADYSAVDAAIAKANALKKDDYKNFSDVETAVNAVVRGKPLSEQAKVDAMAQVIENAITALQYKDADYSAVDAAIAKANALKKDDYKDFSAVDAAVNAVVRGKTFKEQDAVDAMAKAIETAIAALQYKGADYSAVDAAIAKANALNKDEYKDFSAVEAAVRTVVRGKPLSEQAAVDAMAKAIEDAIAALEKKPVEMTVQLPQTGDDSNLALWTALLLVSGAAIGTMMAGKKKNYGK